MNPIGGPGCCAAAAAAGGVTPLAAIFLLHAERMGKHEIKDKGESNKWKQTREYNTTMREWE